MYTVFVSDEKYKDIEISGRKYRCLMRRSRRAKHISLHVTAKAEIELVVPWRLSWAMGERFVAQKQKWLLRVLQQNEVKKAEVPERKLQNGDKLPLLGDERGLEVVIEKERQRAYYTDGPGVVSVFVAEQKEVSRVIERWYRREARDYFEWECRKMARRLGKRVGRIVVSGAGSQWGSCNKSSGRISLSWRLMMASRAVADYVIAHEVVHLEVTAHNRLFWSLVGKLMPDYQEQRNWLRRFGHTLVL